jgi:hypothetical protein
MDVLIAKTVQTITYEVFVRTLLKIVGLVVNITMR